MNTKPHPLSESFGKKKLTQPQLRQILAVFREAAVKSLALQNSLSALGHPIHYYLDDEK